MKKAHRSVSLILAALLALSPMAIGSGCSKSGGSSSGSSSGSSASSAPDTSKFVTVSMYLLGSPAKDYDQMLAAFNAKAKKDLNCELKVTWIGWGDYSTKYPLILASGEPIDLIYTASWCNFSQEAAKGAFMAIEKLAPQYAPKSYAAQTKGDLKTCSVNGHLYALSPRFSQYATMGYIVRGDLMKKYGMTEIKSLDDYGKYLANVVKYDKGLDPTGFDSQTNLENGTGVIPALLGYYSLGIYNFPLALKTDTKGNPTSEVVNMYEDSRYLSYLQKMKEWSDAGYWPKNVLSNKDTNMLTEGTSASRIHNYDTWRTAYMAVPKYDLQFYPACPNAYLTSAVQDAMAVPASSKNPERALVLLEKIRTDESYYDLLTYGVEGKDYTITDNGELKPTDSSVFAPEGYCSWGFKDPDFLKTLVGTPPTYKEVQSEVKAIGLETPYVNFTFNTDPVKNQVAAISSVMAQYHDPLVLGYVNDPKAGLQTLLSKLKQAGIDDVKAELQKQVTAFINDYNKQ